MFARLNPQAVRALALVLGTLLLLSVAGYGWQRFRRHRAAKAIEATVQHRAARLGFDAHVAQLADSARFMRAGQALEAAHALHLLQKADDSLTRRLPAAPGLPAAPPRY